MPDLTILLIRHAQSQGNLIGRFQGQTDTPLSKEGLSQAERLAGRLANRTIDAVYASDLERAHHTARIIAKRKGLPVHLHPGLREIDIGKWAGLTLEEITAHYADELEAWRQGDPNVRRGGGESYREAQERVVAAVEEIAANNDAGSQIAVVSHGGSLRALLAYVLGFPLSSLWRIQFANTSLSTIERYGPEWSVRQINDVCHLELAEQENHSPGE